MRPTRRSRRTDIFDKGLTPPRAQKVTRAFHPENDPIIADLVDRGEMSMEEVAAMGEVRSREIGLNKRSKSHFERSRLIEKAVMDKRRMQKASEETPRGRRRSEYIGEVSTHAAKFAELSKAKAAAPSIITGSEEIGAMEEHLEKGLDLDGLEPVQGTFQKLPPVVEAPLEKTGRLAQMRGHWDDNPETTEGAPQSTHEERVEAASEAEMATATQTAGEAFQGAPEGTSKKRKVSKSRKSKSRK